MLNRKEGHTATEKKYAFYQETFLFRFFFLWIFFVFFCGFSSDLYLRWVNNALLWHVRTFHATCLNTATTFLTLLTLLLGVPVNVLVIFLRSKLSATYWEPKFNIYIKSDVDIRDCLECEKKWRTLCHRIKSRVLITYTIA